jgi:hypothetical protein
MFLTTVHHQLLASLFSLVQHKRPQLEVLPWREEDLHPYPLVGYQTIYKQQPLKTSGGSVT